MAHKEKKTAPGVRGSMDEVTDTRVGRTQKGGWNKVSNRRNNRKLEKKC